MSNSIDNHIVEMRFDNATFERGVAQTMATLESLDKKLQLQNASKGLNDVNAAANRTNLSNVAAAVDNIQNKFSAMSVVAITALATITNKAVTAGAQIVKSLTIGPISEGFADYNTKLTSVQTIMNATGEKLGVVNNYFKELDTYADKTIYNLTDMTGAFAKFTNAGVDMDKSVPAIKGIANMVAVAGQGADAASIAMYNLSQSIAGGFLTTTDYKSLNLANVATKEWKNNMVQAAVEAGTLKKVGPDAYKIAGQEAKGASTTAALFNEKLAEGWASSDILLKVLGDYGDTTTAIGKKAQAAAQDVKSLPMMMETLKASVGTGWTDSFELLLGNVTESKELFTGLTGAIQGVLDKMSDARNNLLKDWKALGGRTAVIDGVKNAFEALTRIFIPLKTAFREIFPATTGKQLADLSNRFRDFMKSLQIGSETTNRLRRTFAGVFAILGIGWEIIKQVGRAVGELFGAFGDGEGGVLKVTSSIGDFLVKLHSAIKNGEGLTQFFDGLIAVLKVPIKLFKAAGNAIGDFFQNLDLGKLGDFNGKMEPLGALGETISRVWEKVTSVFDDVASAMSGSGGKAADIFSSVSDAITNGLQNIDFDKVLSVLNTGLFAGLVLLVKKFVGSFGDASDSFVGLTDRLMSPFDQLTDTLGAMQNTLRAATLLQIAIAVGVLAASVVALSKVDAEGLTRALVALTILFTQLTIAMAIFQKIDIKGGMLQLILIAAALRILTSSVVELADLNWDELARGLTGTAVLLGAVIATAQLMPDGKKMISSSIGIVILAAGIKLLVGAVTDLSGLSWEDMAKGLAGVAGLLVSLALFTKFATAGKTGILAGAGLVLLAVGIKILASAMEDIAKLSWEDIGKGLTVVGVGLAAMGAALALIPPSSIINAAAIAIVAASMKIIADVVADMGDLEWEEIGKGLAVLAGALTAISLAIGLLPPTSLLSAAAIYIVASSLGMMADALGQMGSMGWDEIARGLVLLGGSLAIIAIAMAAMTGALPGAAALLVVSASLAILSPILLAFSEMSWGEIVKGLVMLAGVFAVLGIAGALLTPVIPTLLGLGISIALLGVGIAAAGVGVLAFSVALTALAAAGGAATLAIVGIVSGLIGLIPMVMEQIGLGLVAFAKVIATAGPAIADAMTAVLLALLTSIERVAPKVVQVLLKMLFLMLNAMEKAVPKMVSSGMRIVAGILDGIAKNIGKVIQKATDVIVAFLTGIQKALPRIIDAGIKTIIAFVNGVADGIRKNTAQMNAAGRNLASAIVDGMVSGIAGGISAVTGAAKRLAQSALDSAKNLLGIRSPSREFAKLGKYSAQGFAIGLDGNKAQIYKAIGDMSGLLRDAMANAKDDIKKAEARLKKLNSAKKKDQAAIRQAKADLAQAKAEQRKAAAAYRLLGTYKDERAKLGKLANQYDVYTTKIKNAQQALADITKTRDDYNKSITDQYKNLPDIADDTKLPDYIQSLEKQVADTQIFSAQLQELRKLGLNDDVYKELLSKGTSAMPFVQQLLEGGKGSIDQVNTLNSSLNKAAAALGSTASTALYQAGVDAAAGLVKGLQKQQAALEAQMDKLATSMVNAIKKKLGIRSPSRVFAEVGDWSAKGLADGLEASSAPVHAAEKVGAAAIEAMRKTLTDLPSLVTANVDMTPTIRPVLDLTDVKKDAGLIGSMISARPLEVGNAYSLAAGTSRDMQAAEAYAMERAYAAGTPVQPLSFVQNNYSPKALAAAEIYRKNKSLIATAKGVLKK